MNKKAQRILDATVLLFLRDGVKKVTMDEIAESAKASKVTIYKYFSDKDTLYLEVGKHILSRQAGLLEDVAALPQSLTAKFHAALEVVSAFTDSGKFALCGELAAYNPSVDAELAAYGQVYRNTLYTLIDEGMAAGRMKRELDREMIFRYVDMGVMYYQQNAAYRAKMRGDGAFRERYLLFFVKNIFADGAAVLAGS